MTDRRFWVRAATRGMKAHAIALAVLVALVLAMPAGASTIEFNATFMEQFQRGGPFPHECDGPAPPSPGCFGGGQIRGFGKATETFVSNRDLTGPDENGCFHLTGTTTITLADGSGSLTTDESYTDCRPGNSGGAPGSEVSYGNPIKTVGTWTVIDASGVFAGTEGSSGSVEVIFAGAALVIHYEGVLTT